MENFAVIVTGGKQYIAKEGEKLVVDKVEGKEKDTVVFDKVVLYAASEKDIMVGKPYLEGVKVEATVTKQEKGEKIEVRRFRAKSRYRKTRGFRPQLTEVEISKITLRVGSKK